MNLEIAELIFEVGEEQFFTPEELIEAGRLLLEAYRDIKAELEYSEYLRLKSAMRGVDKLVEKE